MSFGVGEFKSCTQYKQEYMFCQWKTVISRFINVHRSSDSRAKIAKSYKKGQPISPDLTCKSGNTFFHLWFQTKLSENNNKRIIKDSERMKPAIPLVNHIIDSTCAFIINSYYISGLSLCLFWQKSTSFQLRLLRVLIFLVK